MGIHRIMLASLLLLPVIGLADGPAAKDPPADTPKAQPGEQPVQADDAPKATLKDLPDIYKRAATHLELEESVQLKMAEICKEISDRVAEERKLIDAHLVEVRRQRDTSNDSRVSTWAMNEIMRLDRAYYYRKDDVLERTRRVAGAVPAKQSRRWAGAVMAAEVIVAMEGSLTPEQEERVYDLTGRNAGNIYKISSLSTWSSKVRELMRSCYAELLTDKQREGLSEAKQYYLSRGLRIQQYDFPESISRNRRTGIARRTRTPKPAESANQANAPKKDPADTPETTKSAGGW